MSRWTSGTLLRSVCVGLVAMVVDLALLASLVDVLGVHVRAASVLALTTGIVLQFVGNKLVAFAD
jgi:putative flippase GtrA